MARSTWRGAHESSSISPLQTPILQHLFAFILVILTACYGSVLLPSPLGDFVLVSKNENIYNGSLLTQNNSLETIPVTVEPQDVMTPHTGIHTEPCR